MKLLETKKRRAIAAGGAGLLAAAAITLALVCRRPTEPHIQIVLASDGAVMVAGIPGRSMRAQIQNPSFWDQQSPMSSRLVEFLKGAKFVEELRKTYDGRAGVVVDDHASFIIARMLVASVRTAYPEVYVLHGTVADLPPKSAGADPAHPLGSYVKDCSVTPAPPGCAAAKK